MISKIASGMIKQDTLAEIFNENLEFLVFFSLQPKNCKLNLQDTDTEEIILLYLAACDPTYHCFFLRGLNVY
jgi:hypothetical protein